MSFLNVVPGMIVTDEFNVTLTSFLQLSKMEVAGDPFAYCPNVTPSGMTNEVIPLPWKAAPPMVFKLVGKAKDSKAEQLKNIEELSSSTSLLKATEAKAASPLKRFVPSVTAPSALKDVIAVHFSKALLPNSVTAVGNVTSVKAAHPENAFVPIEVMPSGKTYSAIFLQFTNVYSGKTPSAKLFCNVMLVASAPLKTESPNEVTLAGT